MKSWKQRERRIGKDLSNTLDSMNGRRVLITSDDTETVADAQFLGWDEIGDLGGGEGQGVCIFIDGQDSIVISRIQIKEYGIFAARAIQGLRIITNVKIQKAA